VLSYGKDIAGGRDVTVAYTRQAGTGQAP
jgi:hypothetical protein